MIIFMNTKENFLKAVREMTPYLLGKVNIKDDSFSSENKEGTHFLSAERKLSTQWKYIQELTGEKKKPF